MIFPKEIIEKYKQLTDFDEYLKAVSKFARKSIRVNTLKISVKELKPRLKNWKLTQIPWCKEGFWIEGERRDLGHLIEHQLGYVYVQEASSMIPPLVLEPKPNEIVLDACAAPGSKTTQMAAMMENTGLIIANDKNYKRITALSANLQRCGVLNAIITLADFRGIKGTYPKILLDAPCSASGTIKGETRHSLNTLQTLKTNYIKSMAGVQKQMLLYAYSLLEKNGTLVYSTCSLEPEEDEEVIEHLLKNTNAKLEKINLKIKSDSRIKECIKVWPQFYDSEGFFIAKIRKL